jgi:hypothetical protein
MRASGLLLAATLAACATPPRVDDRSTPKLAYETFRGAMARGEIEREYACFSLEMRERRLGMSLGEYRDARTVALDARHLVVRGVRRSKVASDPRPAEDVADLEIVFPFGYRARARMRREAVLRVFLDGKERPVIERRLPQLLAVPRPEGVEIAVPAGTMAAVAGLFSRAGVRRVEAALEWFLDDFEFGGKTPASVREEAKAARRSDP